MPAAPGERVQAASPFHDGEHRAQERVGVREKLDGFARRFIRDEMPDQLRAFFPHLPFLVIGTVDDTGRPWASVVAAPPGFATSPDARCLRVAARPLAGDPLAQTLRPGRPIGVLGIQLETRRRNRVNGTISTVDADHFDVAVRQAFGNCPQYIQTRTAAFDAVRGAQPGRPLPPAAALDGAARRLVESADTLFIASAYSDGSDSSTHGADVSHRGGKPGFVCVEDDRTLLLPDYSGNFYFNTIGNILLNPRAGLLFLDFDRGDVLYLTTRAEVIWEGEEVRAFAGAERLLRFRIEQAVRVDNSLPLRFRFREYSPLLEATGSWPKARQTIAANRQRDTYIPLEVFKIERESETIASFSLRRVDGQALASHEAGQFLPIRIAVPGTDAPALRNYTVSDAPDRDHYRLSIKREESGLVSRYLHDHAAPGLRIEAMAPHGGFVLDPASERPVVLISAGVGITPMLAMANHLIHEGRRTRTFRPTVFLHGTKNGRSLAFGPHLRGLARVYESFSLHIRFSQPDATDRLGETHDSVGHIDAALVASLLPDAEADFYLCGPVGFMQSLYDGLTGLGIGSEHIHYESFGPATVLTPNRTKLPGATISGDPVLVHFAASNVEATWTAEQGTLLELAEAAGLSPAFGCRTGICGTCATRLDCGAVDYVQEPVGPRAEGEVLICCATPRSTSGAETCGTKHGVVLDL
jgi:Flavodoxin reductases (ferredoxin-NADPH reductases) family 1